MRDFEDIKVAVAGTGYVGLSIATLLSQHHEVVAVDIISDKIDKINNGISPIQDDYIESFLAEKKLKLKATLDGQIAYKNADFVVIAAPTNYDSNKNFFETSHVEDVIELVLSVNPNAIMIIKSTIPVGYTESLYKKYGENINLLFSPEFLRESKALYDNLYPSRIIIGVPKVETCNITEKKAEELQTAARIFADLLVEGAIGHSVDYVDDQILDYKNYPKQIPCLFMGLTEAEAVKLFS